MRMRDTSVLNRLPLAKKRNSSPPRPPLDFFERTGCTLSNNAQGLFRIHDPISSKNTHEARVVFQGLLGSVAHLW